MNGVERALDSATPKRAANQSGSIGKAISLLKCFVDGQEEWGVRELAGALRQPISSVHRTLRILQREGFLEFDEAQQKYRIGLEFVRIGSVVSGRSTVTQVATPVMKKLVQQTQESVWLALYEPNEKRTLYVAEERSPHPLHQSAPIGKASGLDEDITGLVVRAYMPGVNDPAVPSQTLSPDLVAELTDIRRRGYAAMTDEGRQITLFAAPILDRSLACAGVLVLSVPVHRSDPRSEERFTDALVAAASQVSHYLGAQLLGGASSGSWRDGLELMAGLMRSHVAGLIATPALGGGARNVTALVEGLGAYGMTTLPSLEAAYGGRSPFAKPNRDLRLVMSLSRLHLHVIAQPGLDILKVEDLARYRVSPGLTGFSTYQAFLDLLNSAGISETDFSRNGGSIMHFDYPEAARQFKARNIDVLFWATAVPNDLIYELLRSSSAQTVRLGQESFAPMIAQNESYQLGVIKAGTYPTLLQDLSTISMRTVLATTTDRPEFEVFSVARTIYEHRSELMRASPTYAEMTRDFVAQDCPVPFHNGALAYWKTGTGLA